MIRDKLPLQPAIILWICISSALIYAGWGHIISRSGWDPDDLLRLVQLRDFLHGQSWFDTTQYRMNAPQGAPMHWSRLIELPLALFVIPLTPLFGAAAAEAIAGTIVPLLGLGFVAYFIGQVTTRLASREAGLVAVAITLLSPALLMQFRPMRIDHHGWQIVMAALSLWTLYWGDKKRGGLVLGIALAIWQHISLEGAPMAAAFFMLLGWRWIFEKAHGQRLLWAINSFLTMSVLLFLGTQRHGLFAPTYCDTISPPHIAAIILAASIMNLAILSRPSNRAYRLLATVFAGFAAAAALLIIAPQCAKGAFGNLDPLVREYWYVHVNEGLPVWHQGIRDALGLLAGPICGVVAWFAIQQNMTGKRRSEFRAVGFFLIYGAILSTLVFRTVSVASAFAIPPVAIWITQLLNHYRKSHIPVRRIGLVAAILALVIPGAIITSVLNATQKHDSHADTASAAGCESIDSIATLSAIKDARFVAPFDMGPAILLATPNQVLASSHHRNMQAMHDHIEIFRQTPDAARILLRKHGITHIAVCPDEGEMNYYIKRDPYGLWANLARGNTPFFLEKLPNMGAGIQIWRVRF